MNTRTITAVAPH